MKPAVPVMKVLGRELDGSVITSSFQISVSPVAMIHLAKELQALFQDRVPIQRTPSPT